MNNIEIADFANMINKNSDIHTKMKSEIDNIIESCTYAGIKDREFAGLLQGCVKHFYKGKLKTDFGKAETGRTTFQISKRGMGTKGNYDTNMNLMLCFLKSPIQWHSDEVNRCSFQYALDTKEIYDGLNEKISEDGVKFFSDLKHIMDKYKLTSIRSFFSKDIKIPTGFVDYVNAETNLLKLSFDSGNVRADLKVKGSGRYNGGKEIFGSRTPYEDLEIRILQVYFKEQIIAFINDANEHVIPRLKKWKEFEFEFNQLVAKYAVIGAI